MGGATEKEMLDILETAIKRESAAQELYLKGAEIATRLEIKKLFKKLAEEEKGHELLLKDIYNQVKKQLGLKILGEDD